MANAQKAMLIIRGPALLEALARSREPVQWLCEGLPRVRIDVGKALAIVRGGTYEGKLHRKAAVLQPYAPSAAYFARVSA